LPLASWTDAAGRRAGSYVCVLGWDMLNILNRDAKQGHDAIARTELPFLQERGAAVLGAYTVWYGTRTPQAVVLLA
jgi:hypothetical protein